MLSQPPDPTSIDHDHRCRNRHPDLHTPSQPPWTTSQQRSSRDHGWNRVPRSATSAGAAGGYHRRAGRVRADGARPVHPATRKHGGRVRARTARSSAPRMVPLPVVRRRRHASPSTGRHRRRACRWTARRARRGAQQGGHRHSSCCSAAGTSSRYWSPRSATKPGWVATVTPTPAMSATLSSGTTAPCSMRSGWGPPTAAADRVTTSCAAVTQCTARDTPLGVALQRSTSSRRQVEIGVVQNPFAGSKAVHALVQFAVAMGLVSFTTSATSISGVASVTPVTPNAPSRRLTSVSSVSLRCRASDQVRSALRSRPSG